MASDTDTKKTEAPQSQKPRWFRLAQARPDMPELDNIFDLYWGGPERRITGITLRIIAVNAIALLILVFGILYLGQYQKNIINARLETFESELELITIALSENALSTNEDTGEFNINSEKAYQLISRLSQTSRQRIQIFNLAGNLVFDSRTIPGKDDRIWSQQNRYQERFQSVEVLKRTAKFFLELLPDRQTLPTYPNLGDETNGLNVPDVADALKNIISISVWQNQQERIFLSAAAPLRTDDYTHGGAVLITREGHIIEQDIGRLWIDILKIFLGTLIVTTALSIYLSGVIARPLKKLAKSAEAVRTGKATAHDIPDLSHRHDEIGELSVVLKQMTEALWERMDSIEQFAADVSHELKNPLTSLRSAVETASVVKKAGDRKKLMDIVKHDIERLDRLITDISNASRIDAELSREEFEKIELGVLLANLLDAYAANPLKREEKQNNWGKTVKAQDAKITLHSTTQEEAWVWGLEGRLAQVFQNLISNALTFSPKNAELSVMVIPLPKKISITFEDEGPGIPEGKLATIFERFYSERPESESYGKHSGLGLSICKQIVEAHRGQIFAENIKDEKGTITGARFTVVLNRA